jgi:hypothetical protein
MNRARFLLKAVLASVLVAGLGAGAALVALKAFFPEPKLRAWAVESARRQLGREVKLEGIGLGLGGIRLRGLEISEKPDFTAGTFLRVESFRLRPSWKAALRRKLVVAAVSADGLKVNVIKEADGRFNYETLASSGAAEAPAAVPTAAPAGQTPPAELNVRRALISNGTIEYQDRASGAKWTLTAVELDVADFGQAGAFPVSASMRARGRAGERPVDAKLSFDGTVDLARGDRAGFKSEIKRLIVEQDGVKLTASGKASGLDAPRVSFDAALSAEGKALLRAQGTASLGDEIESDVQIKTPALDTRLLAKLAPTAGIPALNLPPLELHLAGRSAAGRADVKAFSAAWAGGKIEGSGAARGLGGAKPSYEGIAAFGLDVPELKSGDYTYLKLPPKLTIPAGRLDGRVALSGDVLKIAALTAKLKAGTVAVTGSVRGLTSAKPSADADVVLALDLPAFKASDLPVAVSALPASLMVPAARVDGIVHIAGDDVRFKNLTLKAKGSWVRLNGTVVKALAGAPQPDVDVSADLVLPELTDKDIPFAGVPAGLKMPPSHWTAEAAVSTRLIRVKSLRLLTGKNDVEVSGTVADPSGRGAFDLLVKCRSFVLEEITALTPKTRELKLGGSGFFALSVTGRKEQPVYSGKLQFKDLGATVAGLPLSNFTGTVSFDDRRVDVPNLTGKVADGTLKMDLTVKDYARAPEIQLEADLDRFDLGRWLAAKTKVVADHQSAQAAKPGAAKAPEKPVPISTRGHFNVGTLIHPNATVTDVKVGWDLRGVAADLHGLNGDAKLHVGGGKLLSLADLALQSKIVKILIYPVLIVQKLSGIGNFNNITLNQIVGDYGFKDGVMTLRQSEMDSDSTQVAATGEIDLPAEKINLIVTAQLGTVAPVEVAVTGTFDNPKSKLNIAKFLANPAKQLLQGLLQH